MNAAVQMMVVVGVAAAAAGGTYLVKGPPGKALVCDPATLKPGEICLEQVQEPVVWIDARPRKDWQANGLPGSILWNLDGAEDATAFEAEAMQKLFENPRAVVYCSNEDCGVSQQVAEKIRKLDPDFDVKALRGGWQALKDAGRIKDSSGTP
ncbi:rhodanese-like domain-containing protein [Luteolibacter sp. SL250]|uniref:rhodanese-like domain-containing protein n=1 Tax=Luteolibacter sp. SL250 TaxID=2995170 RepID=UPI00226F0648|nr:rhodanese-like domain-containing protein [Luteolibacter sp. SL250]WAC19207.1 rhodanese-like domain-containing protein [Luteolibacter sp. SL250]